MLFTYLEVKCKKRLYSTNDALIKAIIEIKL